MSEEDFKKESSMSLYMKMALNGGGPKSLKGTEFDPGTKLSFYNLLPDSSVEALNKINPEWFTKDEEYLEKLCSPSASMNRVRLVFWRMYNQAKEMRDPIINWYKLSQTAGVSVKQLLSIMDNPKTLIWVLCPVVHHHEAMVEVYQKALSKMREALDLSIVTADGEMNAKAVQQVVKIFELLDKRAHGEFVQNINVKADSRVNIQKGENGSIEATAVSIDQELLALEEEMKQKGITTVVPELDQKQKELAAYGEREGSEIERLKTIARERGIKIKTTET